MGSVGREQKGYEFIKVSLEMSGVRGDAVSSDYLLVVSKQHRVDFECCSRCFYFQQFLCVNVSRCRVKVTHPSRQRSAEDGAARRKGRG
jgi:hypothetical protein